jgi:hypothetical protein
VTILFGTILLAYLLAFCVYIYFDVRALADRISTLDELWDDGEE